MKIVTFQYEGSEPAMGLLYNNGIVRSSDLSANTSFNSVQAFIESGPEGWEDAKTLLANSAIESVIALDRCKLLAPLPVPVQMRDFMAFEGHVAQSMESIVRLQAMAAGEDPENAVKAARAEGRCTPQRAWYDQPLYYKANRFAVSDPGDDIMWPSYSTVMDYECELACIIGAGGKDIDVQSAADHIFGFTIWNDFSARDAQFAEIPGYLGPAKGKDFDGANAMGPCIVTIDEIGNHYDLDMSVAVNGKRISSGNSGSIHHTFESMIERISASETIMPGEVIGSGTVSGGCGLERMEFLNDGDEVALDITGIGTLRNRVRRRL